MSLKIGPIPSRAPVKMAVIWPPPVYENLAEYARLHNETYGSTVTPADLVVLMAEQFMLTDPGFRRARNNANRPIQAAKE